MDDSKETVSSRHNSTDAYINLWKAQQHAQGMTDRFKPNRVPMMGVEVDMGPHT